MLEWSDLRLLSVVHSMRKSISGIYGSVTVSFEIDGCTMFRDMHRLKVRTLVLSYGLKG